MKNKLFLVGNKAIIRSKKQTDKDLLNSITYIFRESGSATRQAMEKYLIKNDILTLKKIELTSNEAVKQAVIAGLGYSIMPLIGIKNELKNKSLQIIPLKGFPLETHWYLIWPKNKKFSPVAKSYIDFLQMDKGAVIEKHFGWTNSY